MNTQNKKTENRNGSALIIVVVLIVLLSIVGFTFVMLSRTDAVGSEAISKSQRMDAAADFVVQRIADVIAADIFDPNSAGYGYDYPDNNHRWLASIEPYQDFTLDEDDIERYIWRQISDVFGVLTSEQISVRDVPVNPKGWSDATNNRRETIDEYQKIHIPPYREYEPEEDDQLMDENPRAPQDDFSGSYRIGQLLKGSQYPDGRFQGQWADASGDGVADSKWFKVPHLRTIEGEPYYAAIRIIDNSGMVNVNTAYKDGRENDYLPSEDYLFYGDSQLSVNLEGLLHQYDDIDDFFSHRADGLRGENSGDWLKYRQKVVDRLLNPKRDADYKLFSIADELALRNRFCINGGYNSLIEQSLINTINGDWGSKDRPFMGGNYGSLIEWCLSIVGNNQILLDGERINPDRRHLLTTMSKTRELTPEQIKQSDLAEGMQVIPGRRKAYINPVEETDDNEALTIEQIAGNIYYAIKDADFSNTFGDYFTNERLAWHFAVNLVDYQDEDTVPTVVEVGEEVYFGFEGIEEINAILEDSLVVSGIGYFDNTQEDKDAIAAEKYYALAIYNPSGNYKQIDRLNNYMITIIDSNGNERHSFDLYRGLFHSINTTIEGDEVFVISNNRDQGAAHRAFSDGAGNVDVKYEYRQLSFEPDDIILVHKIDWPEYDLNMPVDRLEVPLPLTGVGDLETAQRQTELGIGTNILLGSKDYWQLNVGSEFGNIPSITDSIEINLQVPNYPINIGEIGNVFAIGAYSGPNLIDDMTFTDALERVFADTNIDEKNAGRFDLTDSQTHKLFDYLTAFNTAWDGVNTDGNPRTSDKPDKDFDELTARDYETVVHGRININTAPPKVLEQLPFMTEQLAAVITARRDKQKLINLQNGNEIADFEGHPSPAGYRNIAEILDAKLNPFGGWNPNYNAEYDIQRYGQDGVALDDYPGFMPDDIIDDYRERDILFHRLSNSITVESDVFTAYILLRVGARGEQRRFKVVFDRSNVFERGDLPQVTIQRPSQLGRR